jgi:hypothetical protein
MRGFFMSQSKRDKIKAAVATQRQELTPEEQKRLGESLLGAKSPFRRLLFTIYAEDADWLRKTAGNLKRIRPKTAKSELIRLGVALMKEKSEEELLRRLRELS